MKRFAAVALTLLCSLAFAPAYVPLPAASASDSGGTGSTSYPVALTSAQTLALYGQSIPAYWYNGVSVQGVTFDFYKSSRTVVSSILDSCADNLITNPFISGYNIMNPSALFYNNGGSYIPVFRNRPQSTNVNDLSGWIPDDNNSTAAGRALFAPYEFLIYRCQLDSVPIIPDTSFNNGFDFQFSFDLSVNITGLDGLRTAFGVSSGIWDTYNSILGWGSGYNMSGYYSGLELYSSDNLVPFWVSSDLTSVYQTYTRRVPYMCFPVTNPYEGMTYPAVTWQALFNSIVQNQPNCMLTCVDYHPENSFDWQSFSYTTRRALVCSPPLDGRENPDSPNYAEADFGYVYLFVMCPVFWGDVSMPEPEPPTINEQLDGIGTGINEINVGVGDINVNLSGTNHRLDLILQKLDQIYQEMVDDNSGADLVPPDTIGLSPTAKQRVLDGLSGLDDTMDNVDSDDFNTSAVQGIGSFWQRVKAVLPSGLWSVYMLCLVGGIVSWIIYGKRGG